MMSETTKESTPLGWDDPLRTAKHYMAAVEEGVGLDDVPEERRWAGHCRMAQIASAYALIDIAESLRATGWGARQRSERMRRSRISGEATDE
jgi:hypothetical protein